MTAWQIALTVWVGQAFLTGPVAMRWLGRGR